MASKKLDVIIAGSGPAGSTLGRLLAQQGLDVLVLERRTFPRYKPCGGGVTPKALKYLPPKDFPVEKVISELVFLYRYGDPLRVSYGEPLIYLTSREKLDGFLAEECALAGALLHQGETVTHCEVSEKDVRVVTDKGTYSAEIVCAADGARSTVRRSLGLHVPLVRGMAIDSMIEADADYPAVILNHGSSPSGYEWIFPKNGYISSGVGTFISDARNLKASLLRLKEALGLSGRIIKERAHFLPTLHNPGTLHGQRCIVLGDAAGLIDPFTGEGIYWALASAHLAAQTILHSFSKGDPADLSSYTKEVNRSFWSELTAARRISKIVFTFPLVVHKIMKKSNSLKLKLAKVITGGLSYNDLYRALKQLL